MQKLKHLFPMSIVSMFENCTAFVPRYIYIYIYVYDHDWLPLNNTNHTSTTLSYDKMNITAPSRRVYCIVQDISIWRCQSALSFYFFSLKYKVIVCGKFDLFRHFFWFDFNGNCWTYFQKCLIASTCAHCFLGNYLIWEPRLNIFSVGSDLNV